MDNEPKHYYDIEIDMDAALLENGMKKSRILLHLMLARQERRITIMAIQRILNQTQRFLNDRILKIEFMDPII